jgi:hypothetical protein
MRSRHRLGITFAAIIFAGSHWTAGAQESGWAGTWTGLWEEKTQAEVTINGDAVEYRMQGLKAPVSDVKVDGPVLTFSIGLNGENSTVVLRKTSAGAEGAFLSPGGTRHEGRFVNLANSRATQASALRVDSTPTSSITPAPEVSRKR